MDIGFIGLGKMGSAMVARLEERGHHVQTFDVSGLGTARSLEELLEALDSPRVIWLMVPHQVVDTLLAEITPLLVSGDVVIDGGNSNFMDSKRRALELEKKGAHFLDVGVSGGPAGAREGACLMIGGDSKVIEQVDSVFLALAAPDSYSRVGASGAGHFVKMVHNGIEYGMMQAIAEGFTLIHESEFELDPKVVADLYQHESIIESELIEHLIEAYDKFGGKLSGVTGSVTQSGEGRWTTEYAKKVGISVPVISKSVEFRDKSEQSPSYTGKILMAMRNIFGGHNK